MTETLRHRDIMTVSLTAPVHDTPARAGGVCQTAGCAFFAARTARDGKAVEETATAWRVLVNLQAGETRKLVAYADTPVSSQLVLLADNGAFDDDVLAAMLAQGTLNGTAREQFQVLGDLRATEAAKRTALRTLTDEARPRVGQDEDRVRRNLQAVVMPGNFHDKLIDALEVDEARLGALRHDIARAQGDVDPVRMARWLKRFANWRFKRAGFRRWGACCCLLLYLMGGASLTHPTLRCWSEQGFLEEGYGGLVELLVEGGAVEVWVGGADFRRHLGQVRRTGRHKIQVTGVFDHVIIRRVR